MPPSLIDAAVTARKAKLVAAANDLRAQICGEAVALEPIATSLEIGVGAFRLVARLAKTEPAANNCEDREARPGRLQRGMPFLLTGWEIYKLFRSKNES